MSIVSLCSGKKCIVTVYAVKGNVGKSYVNTVVFSIYSMHMWNELGAQMIEHAKFDRFGVRTRYKNLSRTDEVIYGSNQRNLAFNRGDSVWRINIEYTVESRYQEVDETIFTSSNYPKWKLICTSGTCNLDV